MILSDKSIRTAIEEGRINILPFDEDLVQPASIDLRLGKDFMTILPGASSPIIEPVGLAVENAINYERVICNKLHPFFYLFPNQLVLANTLERITMSDDLLGRLEGKASLGRMGISFGATSGHVAPGFEGELTLVMHNITNRPIKLIPGMAIAQLSFEELDQPAERVYGENGLGSHYQNQRGATPADFTKRG